MGLLEGLTKHERAELAADVAAELATDVAALNSKEHIEAVEAKAREISPGEYVQGLHDTQLRRFLEGRERERKAHEAGNAARRATRRPREKHESAIAKLNRQRDVALANLDQQRERIKADAASAEREHRDALHELTASVTAAEQEARAQPVHIVMPDTRVARRDASGMVGTGGDDFASKLGRLPDKGLAMTEVWP